MHVCAPRYGYSSGDCGHTQSEYVMASPSASESSLSHPVTLVTHLSVFATFTPLSVSLFIHVRPTNSSPPTPVLGTSVYTGYTGLYRKEKSNLRRLGHSWHMGNQTPGARSTVDHRQSNPSKALAVRSFRSFDVDLRLRLYMASIQHSEDFQKYHGNQF